MVDQLYPHWRARSIPIVQGLEFITQLESIGCACLEGAPSPTLAAPDQDPRLRVTGSGAGLGLRFSPKDGPDVIIQGQGIS